MKCPACAAGPLVKRELITDLTAYSCDACRGVWINGQLYYDWLDRGGAAGFAPTQHAAEQPLPADPLGPAKARICPECSRLLTKYEVGSGPAFTIERCGNCAGVWLDPLEFDALLARNLHNKIHFVFSSAYRAELLRQKVEQNREDLLRSQLGDDDYEEAKRTRKWVDGHKHRAEILAYLTRG